MATLYEARGEALTIGQIAKAVGCAPASVKGRISEARQALACEALDTRGARYALSEVGMAEVRRAILQVADELLELAEMVQEAEARPPIRLADRACASDRVNSLALAA